MGMKMSFTRLEKILIFCAVVTMLAAIVMAFSIGLVLPKYWFLDGYVPRTDLLRILCDCQCPAVETHSANRATKQFDNYIRNQKIVNFKVGEAPLRPKNVSLVEEKGIMGSPELPFSIIGKIEQYDKGGNPNEPKLDGIKNICTTTAVTGKKKKPMHSSVNHEMVVRNSSLKNDFPLRAQRKAQNNLNVETKHNTTKTTEVPPKSHRSGAGKRSCSKMVTIGNNIQDYPFLATLSIPRYSDSTEERILACSGTIISRKRVLAGGRCIREASEWSNLQVRVGSEYWSKGGIVHKIKKIVSYEKNGPLLLEVDSEFHFGEYIKIGDYLTVPYLVAFSVGWRDLRSNALNQKFATFSVDVWIRDNHHNCKESQLNHCKNGSLGHPIFYRDLLLGIRCENIKEISDVETPHMIPIWTGIQQGIWYSEKDWSCGFIEVKNAVNVCVPKVFTGEVNIESMDYDSN